VCFAEQLEARMRHLIRFGPGEQHDWHVYQWLFHRTREQEQAEDERAQKL